MIRQESLEEISDGKLYSENDCVRQIQAIVPGAGRYVVREWKLQ